MCVLGAINEGYESLDNVNMYVCMCLKVNVNYGQPVFFLLFFFFKSCFSKKTQLVYMIVRILNLEGKKNCIIGSKVTNTLPTSF